MAEERIVVKWITELDDRGFRRYMNAIGQMNKATQTSIQFQERLRKQTEDINKQRLRRVAGRAGEDIEIDTSKAQEGLERLSRVADHYGENIVEGNRRVEKSFEDVDKSIGRLSSGVNTLGRNSTKDVKDLDVHTNRLGNTMQKTTAQIERGTKRAAQETRNLTREFDRNSRAVKQSETAVHDIDKAFDRLTRRFIGARVSGNEWILVALAIAPPALPAALGTIAGGLNTVAGAAVGAAAELAPLAGGLVGLIDLLGASKQATTVFKLATEDLGKTLDLALTGKLADFNKQLQTMTPEAEAFAQTVRREFRPLFQNTLRGAQAGMFAGFEQGIKRLKPLAKELSPIFIQTGNIIGQFVDKISKVASSPGWRKDIADQAKANNRWLKAMQPTIINLATAFRDILVSARPLVDWFLKLTNNLSVQIEAWAHLQRVSGGFGRFFKETEKTAEGLIPIISNLGHGLFNILKGARDLGDSMTGALGKASLSFRRWTESAEGSRKIRKFFEDIKPAVFETARLLRDMVGTLIKIGSSQAWLLFVHTIRTELLPVLQKVVIQSTRAFGPTLIRLLNDLAEVLVNLTRPNGPLQMMLQTVDKIAKAFNFLVENSAAARRVLELVFSVIGVTAVANLVGLDFVIKALINRFKSSGTAAKQAAEMQIAGAKEATAAYDQQAAAARRASGAASASSTLRGRVGGAVSRNAGGVAMGAGLVASVGGAALGGRAGGILEAAGAGALIGGTVGPWGALAGGVIGAVGGLVLLGKKANEAAKAVGNLRDSAGKVLPLRQRQRELHRDIQDARSQVIYTGAGVTQAKTAREEFINAELKQGKTIEQIHKMQDYKVLEAQVTDAVHSHANAIQYLIGLQKDYVSIGNQINHQVRNARDNIDKLAGSYKGAFDKINDNLAATKKNSIAQEYFGRKLHDVVAKATTDLRDQAEFLKNKGQPYAALYAATIGDLVGKLGRLPTQKEINVTLKTGDANIQIARMMRALADAEQDFAPKKAAALRKRSNEIVTDVHHHGMAFGGRVPGAPTPADSVPAMLSPREFVVTGHGERMLESMTFPGVLDYIGQTQAPHFREGGRVQKFAGGGRVQSGSFASDLAQKTGLSPLVTAAWVRAEGNGGGANNWLNVHAGPGGRGYSGVPEIPGKLSGFAGFSSNANAVRESAYWVNSMSNYAGIRASKNSSPAAQIAAIKASPWDAGHYAGGNLYLSGTAAATVSATTTKETNPKKYFGPSEIPKLFPGELFRGANTAFERGYAAGLAPHTPDEFLFDLLGEGVFKFSKASKEDPGPDAGRGSPPKIPRILKGAHLRTIQRVISAANELQRDHVPYVYGGGHTQPARFTGGKTPSPGSHWAKGLDCSSSVAWVLQHAGINFPTGTSETYQSYGGEGEGKHQIDIYARGAGVHGHTFLGILDRFFGTSDSNAQGGPGWLGRKPRGEYVVRHVPGFRRGGRVGFQGGGRLTDAGGGSVGERARQTRVHAQQHARPPRPRTRATGYHHDRTEYTAPVTRADIRAVAQSNVPVPPPHYVYRTPSPSRATVTRGPAHIRQVPLRDLTGWTPAQQHEARRLRAPQSSLEFVRRATRAVIGPDLSEFVSTGSTEHPWLAAIEAATLVTGPLKVAGGAFELGRGAVLGRGLRPTLAAARAAHAAPIRVASRGLDAIRAPGLQAARTAAFQRALEFAQQRSGTKINVIPRLGTTGEFISPTMPGGAATALVPAGFSRARATTLAAIHELGHGAFGHGAIGTEAGAVGSRATRGNIGTGVRVLGREARAWLYALQRTPGRLHPESLKEAFSGLGSYGGQYFGRAAISQGIQGIKRTGQAVRRTRPRDAIFGTPAPREGAMRVFRGESTAPVSRMHEERAGLGKWFDTRRTAAEGFSRRGQTSYIDVPRDTFTHHLFPRVRAFPPEYKGGVLLPNEMAEQRRRYVAQQKSLIGRLGVRRGIGSRAEYSISDLSNEELDRLSGFTADIPRLPWVAPPRLWSIPDAQKKIGLDNRVFEEITEEALRHLHFVRAHEGTRYGDFDHFWKGDPRKVVELKSKLSLSTQYKFGFKRDQITKKMYEVKNKRLTPYTVIMASDPTTALGHAYIREGISSANVSQNLWDYIGSTHINFPEEVTKAARKLVAQQNRGIGSRAARIAAPITKTPERGSNLMEGGFPRVHPDELHRFMDAARRHARTLGVEPGLRRGVTRGIGSRALGTPEDRFGEIARPLGKSRGATSPLGQRRQLHDLLQEIGHTDPGTGLPTRFYYNRAGNAMTPQERGRLFNMTTVPYTVPPFARPGLGSRASGTPEDRFGKIARPMFTRFPVYGSLHPAERRAAHGQRQLLYDLLGQTEHAESGSSLPAMLRVGRHGETLTPAERGRVFGLTTRPYTIPPFARPGVGSRAFGTPEDHFGDIARPLRTHFDPHEQRSLLYELLGTTLAGHPGGAMPGRFIYGQSGDLTSRLERGNLFKKTTRPYVIPPFARPGIGSRYGYHVSQRDNRANIRALGLLPRDTTAHNFPGLRGDVSIEQYEAWAKAVVKDPNAPFPQRPGAAQEPAVHFHPSLGDAKRYRDSFKDVYGPDADIWKIRLGRMKTEYDPQWYPGEMVDHKISRKRLSLVKGIGSRATRGVRIDHSAAVGDIRREVTDLLGGNQKDVATTILYLREQYAKHVMPDTQRYAALLKGAGVHGALIHPQVNVDSLTTAGRPFPELGISGEYRPSFWTGIGPRGGDVGRPGFTTFPEGKLGFSADDVLDMGSKFEQPFRNKYWESMYFKAVAATRGELLSGPQRVFRGMNPRQHEEWLRGGKIKAGTFFTGHRTEQFAQDVAGQFPSLYSLKVRGEDLIQTSPGQYQLAKDAFLHKGLISSQHGIGSRAARPKSFPKLEIHETPSGWTIHVFRSPKHLDRFETYEYGPDTPDLESAVTQSVLGVGRLVGEASKHGHRNYVPDIGDVSSELRTDFPLTKKDPANMYYSSWGKPGGAIGSRAKRRVGRDLRSFRNLMAPVSAEHFGTHNLLRGIGSRAEDDAKSWTKADDDKLRKYLEFMDIARYPKAFPRRNIPQRFSDPKELGERISQGDPLFPKDLLEKKIESIFGPVAHPISTKFAFGSQRALLTDLLGQTKHTEPGSFFGGGTSEFAEQLKKKTPAERGRILGQDLVPYEIPGFVQGIGSRAGRQTTRTRPPSHFGAGLKNFLSVSHSDEFDEYTQKLGFKPDRYKDSYLDALDMTIGRVHGLPTNLPKIRFGTLEEKNTFGMFYTRREADFRTFERAASLFEAGLTSKEEMMRLRERAKRFRPLAIATEAMPHISTGVHEVGHYLDLSLFGELGGSPGTFRGYGSETSRSIGNIVDSVRGNESHKMNLGFNKLLTAAGHTVGAGGRKPDEYYDNPREIFARTYAQWIGTKAKIPNLREWLRGGDNYLHEGEFNKTVVPLMDNLFAQHRLLRTGIGSRAPRARLRRHFPAGLDQIMSTSHSDDWDEIRHAHGYRRDLDRTPNLRDLDRLIGRVHKVPDNLRRIGFGTFSPNPFDERGTKGMFHTQSLEDMGIDRTHPLGISTVNPVGQSVGVHEIGHYLDLAMFGKKTHVPGAFAHYGSEGGGPVGQLVESVKRLKTYQNELGHQRSLGAQGFMSGNETPEAYFSRNREVFARTYAQWIGEKTGKRDLESWLGSYFHLPGKEFHEKVVPLMDNLFGSHGLMKMAYGGRVPGASRAADSVPAMLSPKEFVVTQSGEKMLEHMTFPGVLDAVGKAQAPHFQNGGRVAAMGRVPHFADGGRVPGMLGEIGAWARPKAGSPHTAGGGGGGGVGGGEGLSALLKFFRESLAKGGLSVSADTIFRNRIIELAALAKKTTLAVLGETHLAIRTNLKQLQNKLVQAVRDGRKHDSQVIEREIARAKIALQAIDYESGRRIGLMVHHLQYMQTLATNANTKAQLDLRRLAAGAIRGTTSRVGPALDLTSVAGLQVQRGLILGDLTGPNGLRAQLAQARKTLRAAQKVHAPQATIDDLRVQYKTLQSQIYENVTQQIENAREIVLQTIEEAGRPAARATERATLAQTAGQLLSAQQRLSFTTEFPSAIRSRAQQIQDSLVPQQQQIIAGLKSQLAVLQRSGLGGEELRKKVAELQQQIAQAGVDLANSLADVAEGFRAAAEKATQDIVDLASYNTSVAQSGLTHLELTQRLTGTYDTGGPARSAYITSQIIPQLRGELDALTKQYEVAKQQGDVPLTRSTYLEMATKSNEIAQAQVDALDQIVQNTDSLRNFSGSVGFDFNSQRFSDLIGVGVGA